MDKIRISAVKYANTYPFIYGLTESGFDKKVILETDHPAQCAEKLISGKVDIGLIPVAVLPLLKEHYIISDYCIGADGNVKTVMLLSNCPFEDITTIYLDYRSRSSVNLTKVLASNSWHKQFDWVNTSEDFDYINIKADSAAVLIGDQCFEFEKSFKYRVDLAMAWKDFTGLPFVFACWVANKKLTDDFIDDFNLALSVGVNNICDVVVKYGKSGSIKNGDLEKYLTENIDYKFDKKKKEALNLFLELIEKL
jgi:chorismate dehydratase